ncbi:MAG: alpha/beta hydrolase [Solirubrobacteraceae bacterium]
MGIRRATSVLFVCLLAMLSATATGAASSPMDAVLKSDERRGEYEALDYQAQLVAGTVENLVETVGTTVTDPERLFHVALCSTRTQACGGDFRLYDFERRGRGIQRPVVFTARNGSTISGHVWATKAGPAKRPLIVITNGSIQASEQLYWWAAQSLAKAGYVVLTSDPQGQGRSDLLGAGPDIFEGVHSQIAGNTFYDGTQDALDFALSTPERSYCPRPSRSGTSHCDKQRRRVDGDRATAHNPLWDLVDPDRVGLAGHSYGASGVSWVGQQDPRVDAVVAWDRLCDPSTVPATCSKGGTGGPVALRVPSLSLTADSFLGLEPMLQSGPPADPDAKGAPSRAFSARGIDTGTIVIRGGTHFEFSYIPLSVFRATFRGIDLSAWYTLAWFDRYVKGDATAERRLLTDRWRHDPVDAKIDPAGGGNLFSEASRSRLDVGRTDGTRFRCEDLRAGCNGQADDGQAPGWGYLKVATAPDGTPAVR